MFYAFYLMLLCRVYYRNDKVQEERIRLRPRDLDAKTASCSFLIAHKVAVFNSSLCRESISLHGRRENRYADRKISADPSTR